MLTVAASRAKGRAAPDTPVAPARGFDIVSIRDRQGQEAVLYRGSYALVIGVSGYADWPRLPGVLQDITAVVTMFQAQGFQVEQVLDPTFDDLRHAFDDFINKYGQAEDHRLLIYFAGHGHTLKPKYGGDMGYIVPVDAPIPQRDEAGFRTRALSMQEIETYARRIQSKHVLFLFDSCFSGTIFSLSRAVPEYITYKTRQPVRQFITSGQADETVPDTSIFRQQLVAALQGEADRDGDGYVTGAELGEFLQQQITNYSRDSQHPQYGKLRDPYLDKGDFVFSVVRSASPGRSSPSVADLQAQVEAQRQQVQGERQRLEEERRLREEQQQLQAEQERLRQEREKLQGGGSPQGTPVARLEPQLPQPGKQSGQLSTLTRSREEEARKRRENLIVDDSQLDISIYYTDSGTSAVFAGHLREGWSFGVNVDGNQDGKWGYGADDPQSLLRPTDDFFFGARNDGTLCPGYIYAGRPNDPDMVQRESQCGALPSLGTVDRTSSDRQGFVFLTYKIPKAELFKNKGNAHILISVWDGESHYYYYTLTNPLVLKR
jgi:hypothetical protein